MWQSRDCPSPVDYLGVQRSFRGSLGLPGSPGKFGSPWESAINAVVSAWRRLLVYVSSAQAARDAVMAEGKAETVPT